MNHGVMISISSCFNDTIEIQSSKTKLNEMALWVQVHNIPLGYMDREIAEEICTTVGKVVKIEGLRELGGDSFIRLGLLWISHNFFAGGEL